MDKVPAHQGPAYYRVSSLLFLRQMQGTTGLEDCRQPDLQQPPASSATTLYAVRRNSVDGRAEVRVRQCPLKPRSEFCMWYRILPCLSVVRPVTRSLSSHAPSCRRTSRPASQDGDPRGLVGTGMTVSLHAHPSVLRTCTTEFHYQTTVIAKMASAPCYTRSAPDPGHPPKNGISREALSGERFDVQPRRTSTSAIDYRRVFGACPSGKPPESAWHVSQAKVCC